MKTTIIAWIAVTMLAGGCIRDNFCIHGEGPIERVTLNLEEFHSINLLGSMDVEISYGETQEVIAEGQLNIIDELETRIDDGTWDISLGNGCFTRFDLKIYITLPLVKKIQLTGSGDILTGDIEGPGNFFVESTGSGDITILSVNGSSVITVRLSGSGPIEIEDACPDLKNLKVTCTGSGHFHGFPAVTPECTVIATGSGFCEVTVTDQLNVTISGSGNVYYKGRPLIDIVDTGSGRLVNKN